MCAIPPRICAVGWGVTAHERIQPEAAGRLAALAYPDRLGQRENADRIRLITGQRVQLADDFFGSAEFFGVAHLDGPPHAPRAALAAPLSREELETEFAALITSTDDVSWDAANGRVTARRRRRLGALVLADAALPHPDPATVATVFREAVREAGISKLPWPKEAEHLRERLGFLHTLQPAIWPAVDDATLLAELAEWLEPLLTGLKSWNELSRLDWSEALLSRLPGGWPQRQELDRLAPAHLAVPSGSHIRLDYSEPTAPVLAVRLQEIFGLLDTPTVGGGRVPLTVHLLSPGHRPVQVTRDLRSFWTTGYFEVRKDLRGRYPKHHWPDDPLSATPTNRAKPRGT